ncbi:phenylalanine--tRNA ligase subunit alpha [Nanoarchaeota archaeon]
MDIKELVNKLHPLERKVLPFLSKYSSVKDIVVKSGLKDVEVVRALQWLENKNVLKIDSQIQRAVILDENGNIYVKKGLPERRFLLVLGKKAKMLNEIAKKAELTKQELSVCLGALKSKAAINLGKEISLTPAGKKLLEQETLEERFLKKLSKGVLDPSLLNSEERFALEALKKRSGIIKLQILKTKTVKLTELGKKLVKEKMGTNFADRVTSKMLESGDWKKKKFRAYDIKINVPQIFAGRKQEYRKFLDDVRTKFLSLGFEEMTGPIVESEFWNMDALFMPQFHSARDIHDAYYIKDPKRAKLDPKIVSRVKEAHERGVAGSKGWQYSFDLDKTKNHVLRTQGTACSARKLASKDLKIPGKYFGITRCFRPDVVDATHNADFYQTEGIVVGETLNMRHLFGLLEMFAKEFIGTEEIKIVPGYFPFTEPSCELFAKHPQLGWIELGGAGIFRPELVEPLTGKRLSVLAWGLGIDRIGMFKLGIKDIRQLFSYDLSMLRNMRTS